MLDLSPSANGSHFINDNDASEELSNINRFEVESNNTTNVVNINDDTSSNIDSQSFYS